MMFEKFGETPKYLDPYKKFSCDVGTSRKSGRKPGSPEDLVYKNFDAETRTQTTQPRDQVCFHYTTSTCCEYLDTFRQKKTVESS